MSHFSLLRCRKLLAHLHHKGGTDAVYTPVDVSSHPFTVDSADHCETPFEAYRDIEPFLFQLASSLGKTKETLKIYDPYFCEGSVKRHFERLGFPNVHNENEDFYATIREGRIPEHDVVVTNPPYSGEHMEKCVTWLGDNGKPWLLLVPNFVYKKTYFLDSIQKTDSELNFLVPKTRYDYWSPGRQAEKVTRTSPFPSFWYLALGDSMPSITHWWQKKYSKKVACQLCYDTETLPKDVVPVRTEKRANPKARKRAAAAAKAK